MELRAKGLRKAMKGKVLYQSLDFELHAGQTIVVRGPSGAGKSQLLRQLSGLDAQRPGFLEESGCMSLDGRTFEQWGPFDWRREVSYAPQQVPRLVGSPADFQARLATFKVQREVNERDALALTRDFGLDESHWQQPWAELSIGERQRVLLAIFIARQPAVLLLDEPTAALDPDATLAVEDALRDRACMWVTHHEDQEQRIADDVIDLGAKTHAV